MLTIQLQLLTRCNSKCVFCNKHKWNFHETMSIETVEAAFKKYPEANFIFSGGEPLMYTHLKELNLLIEKYGIRYKVFTNLTLEVNDEIATFLDNATQISTSFDAKDEEQYQVIRNCYTKDAFKNLVNNTARYAAKTRACMVVTKQNYKNLPEIFAMIMILGAKPRFYNVHTYDDLALNSYQKHWLECKLKLDRVNGRAKRASNIVEFMKSLHEEHVEQTQCFVKNHHRVIDELGREYTCCYAFDDNGLEMDSTYAINKVTDFDIVELDTKEMYQYCSKCTRYANANKALSFGLKLDTSTFL